MSRRRDKVSMWYRVWMKSSSNKTSNMCHINHEHCSNIIRNLPQSFKVNRSRVCTSPRNENTWTMFDRELLDFIIINQERVRVNPVTDEIVQYARCINRTTMGQMSAMSKIHP